MKTIVHLSDLHFNAVDNKLIPPLVEAVNSIKPDILAVSGDLTQHAHQDEFEAAMSLIRSLPGHLIVVPGNHDMSFYNLWRRATQRLKLFRKLVTNDPEPFYSDGEITVLGLNTARVSHLRDGRIRGWQVQRMEERMGAAPSDSVKVLVTHHPFDLPDTFNARELVGRGEEYVPRVVKCIDLMLAGHMHISHAGPTALRYKIEGQSTIFVQAGTALSTRVRSECNSFQVIRTTKGSIETQQYLEEEKEFRPKQTMVFTKERGGWAPAKPASASLIS
ncbi:MAG: metallophosphoesterase [Bryobacteraceae bacterium]|nr:metallophosphoesterase [Bryobacteraceae bacterium]